MRAPGLLKQLGTLAVGLAAALGAASIAGRHATAPSQAQAAEPWSAPSEPIPLRSIDDVAAVTSYRLDARLEEAGHTIDGDGTITFVNVSDAPVDHLYFHLYLNAFEHERTVFRRQRGSGMRGYDALDEPGSITVERLEWVGSEWGNLWPEDPHTPNDAEDKTDILVQLPREIAPKEKVTFKVVFHSKLPAIALRTGHYGSFHMVAQWFPKLAKLEKNGSFAHFPFQRFSEFYADFGDYDVTLDVPESYVVGATGKRLEEARAEAGRKRLRYAQRAVTDFAFTAWDGFETLERTAEGVLIQCLYPPEEEHAAEVQIEAAAKGLAFFNAEYGRYPYETLTLVHPPRGADEAGGMEYPTLITTGLWGFTSYLPVRILEGLTLHELAHQWFYGLAASNENASPFLDEGITSYATGRAMEALYGPSAAQGLPFVATVGAFERAQQLGVYDHAPVATPAGDFGSGSDYARLVYARTATILRTLDGAFDGAGARAVAIFSRRHRFGHPGPRDLIAAIREAGGDRAAAVAERAFFSEGHVDFSVSSIDNRPGPGGQIVRSVSIAREGDLALPLEVELHYEDGSRDVRVLDVDEPAVVLDSQGPARLVAVVLDPRHLLLLDERRSNDALTLEPASFAPRTFIVTTALSTLLLHAASP